MDSSFKTSLIVVACLLACGWSALRILRTALPEGEGEELVDVWRCMDEKKEVAFTHQAMHEAVAAGNYEERGGQFYFQCPDCSKISLWHDQEASMKRTEEQWAAEGGGR